MVNVKTGARQTESDYLVTADRVLYNVTKLCRVDAPAALAKPYRLSVEAGVIEEMARIIEDVRERRRSEH